MAQPLFFDPLKDVQDADMLGLGDLVFDDGTRQYVEDPEIASMFPRMGANDDPAQGMQDPNTGELMQPYGAGEEPYGQSAVDYGVDAMQSIGQTQADIFSGRPPPGQQPEQPTDHSGFTPTATPGIEMDPNGQLREAPQQEQQGGGTQEQMAGKGFTPTAVPGIEMDPNGKLRNSSGPDSGYGSGGLQLASREGALPQDVAAQQAAAMDQSHQAMLAATQQSRDAQFSAQDGAYQRRLGELQAEQAHQQKLALDEQAKQQRMRQEQDLLNSKEIATDLVSAQGVLGSILSVAGAALLGYVGSDAGLRMIESSIDMSVKKQLSQRDSKLRVIADRLGSSEQAEAGAKSLLYKTLIEKSATLMDQTKNDAFNKQTPVILERLKAKFLEEDQKAQTASLGKPLEKLPETAKPPTAAQVQGYGESAASQSQGEKDALRALRAIGGQYDPKTGKITNRDEILKTGIPGVGIADTAASDLGEIPGVGKIITAADNAATSKQGLEVRASGQALIQAEARRRQPVGILSNQDMKDAAKSLGMLTEEGYITAIERVLSSQGEAKARNQATFGAGAAGQYEGQLDATGARAPSPTGTPQGYQPLQPGSARQQVQDAVHKPTSGIADPTKEEFRAALEVHASDAGLNPDAVAKIINHESGGSASAVNKATGKHAGLIQFSKETWANLAKEAGTDVTWDDMRKMSPEEQLPYVMQYFKNKGMGPSDDAGDYAMAAFMPAFKDEADDFVLGRKGSKDQLAGLSMAKIWSQNPGLQNGDLITVGDVRRSVL